MPQINIVTFFIIHLFFLNLPLKGQNFEEEIRQALKTKPKLELRYDSRTSFINQTGVRVYGFKMGIQFDQKLSFGLGYNLLGSKIERDIFYEGAMLQTNLKFNLLSPYLEYIFYRDDRWELAIPVQMGFGKSYYKNKNDPGPRIIYDQFVMTYEPAITVQYRFLNYFGAGFGIGYRLMIVPNTAVEEKFTSPVYIFKLKLYFEDIWKDLKETN